MEQEQEMVRMHRLGVQAAAEAFAEIVGRAMKLSPGDGEAQLSYIAGFIAQLRRIARDW